MFLKSIAFACVAAAALAGCTTVEKDGFTNRPDLSLATAAGKSIQMNVYRHINRDCTPRELPTIKVASQSGGGSVSQGKWVQFTSSDGFTGDYAHCNGKKLPGTAVTYTPKLGFVGVDQISLEIFFADGRAWRQNYTVNVR